jgi:co-chaperonin GroES (HSP10)
MGNSVVYQHSGNVGINSTTATNNKFQIGDVGTTGYAGNDLAIGNGTGVMAIEQTSTLTKIVTNKDFSFMPAGVGATGRVGIGTISPNAPLTVIGASSFGGLSAMSGRFSDNANSSLYISHSSTSGPVYSASITSSDDLAFGQTTTGGTTEYMRIKASTGRVGIGTISPARSLHVEGEARISDLATDTPTRIVGADADGDLGAVTLGTGLSISSGTLNGPSVSGTTNYLPKFTGTSSIGNSLFFDNGTQTMIGGTTPAWNLSRFSIYYNASTTGPPILVDTRAYNSAILPGGSWNVGGQYNASGNYASFSAFAGKKENSTDGDTKGEAQIFVNDGTDIFPDEAIRVKSNGRVGIGTTSPARTLHISATDAVRIPRGTTSDRGTGANGDIRYSTTNNIVEWYDTTGNWRQPVISALPTGFGTAGRFAQFKAGGLDSSNVLVQTNDRIGIGAATSPDSTLHVFGGIRTTSGINTGADLTVNGLRVGRGGGNRNTSVAIGLNALNSNNAFGFNVAIGNEALRDQTSGYYNIAIGPQALKSNTNQFNLIAIGHRTLEDNSSGYYNVAVGSRVLTDNTSGNNNTGFGYEALFSNTTGSYNLALGALPLYSNTNGEYNIALGTQALYLNQSGDYNAAIGRSALYNNTANDNFALGAFAMEYITTGGRNVAIGSYAGRLINSGSNNQTSYNSTYIGYDARASANGNQEEIVIGYQARGNGSNTTTIGNSSTVGTYIPAGKMYIGGTTSPGATLHVNGSLSRNAPVTVTANYTVAETVSWIICDGTATIALTLPAAASWTGREIMVKTIQPYTVTSASPNVVPIDGVAATNAILPATDGAWATLVSNGTNWVIMQQK